MKDNCVVCGATVPEGRQICPICNREFEERQAMSRKDSALKICSVCAIKEALDDARVMIGNDMTDRQWEEYKESIISAMN